LTRQRIERLASRPVFLGRYVSEVDERVRSAPIRAANESPALPRLVNRIDLCHAFPRSHNSKAFAPEQTTSNRKCLNFPKKESRATTRARARANASAPTSIEAELRQSIGQAIAASSPAEVLRQMAQDPRNLLLAQVERGEDWT